MTWNESARVVAVVQARMGSTRLPGKVLRPLGDRVVLDWVLRAADDAEGVDEVVVATTTEAADDAIADWVEGRGRRCIRGPELDVLTRFDMARRATSADAVVRLTADCPLLDPVLISQVVAVWRADTRLDYVSTTLERTLPRGLDVELITGRAISHLASSASGWDRVHVTSAMYASDAPYPRAGIAFRPSAAQYRVTLDEPDDAVALDAIVAVLGDTPPAWGALVALLDNRPDIVALNADVEQKPIEQG